MNRNHIPFLIPFDLFWKSHSLSNDRPGSRTLKKTQIGTNFDPVDVSCPIQFTKLHHKHLSSNLSMVVKIEQVCVYRDTLYYKMSDRHSKLGLYQVHGAQRGDSDIL
uniref:Uncharacterized protein n=1 Tax=Cacopsylla melanoneura TaxID=428564 RepID=A0A8D8R535_9HEMI